MQRIKNSKLFFYHHTININDLNDKKKYYYQYDVKFWAKQVFKTESEVFERDFEAIERSALTLFDTPHKFGHKEVKSYEKDHLFQEFLKAYAKVCDFMPNEFYQAMINFY